MNRRNKAAANKIKVAPKIPPAPVNTPIIEETQPVENSTANVVQRMKGLFSPRYFDTSVQFNYKKDDFIISLPAFKPGSEMSLVVFQDGSVGFKENGLLIESDSSFIGNGMVVEIKESVRKLNDVHFIINGYTE